MKKHLKVVAALALVAVLSIFGTVAVIAQVTPLSTDTYGRFLGNGPAPAVSACGTLPVIAGTDTSGTVTIGTGTPAACTLTFARAWSAAPTCYFNDRTTANKTNGTSVIYLVTETPTAVTVTFATATVNGDSIGYMCLGR